MCQVMGTKKELSEKEEQSGLPLLKMASSFAAGVIENSRVPNLLEDIYLSGLTARHLDEADLTADLPCSFLIFSTHLIQHSLHM